MYGQDFDSDVDFVSSSALKFLMQNPNCEDEIRKAKIALLSNSDKRRYLINIEKTIPSFEDLTNNTTSFAGDFTDEINNNKISDTNFEDWFNDEIYKEVKEHKAEKITTDYKLTDEMMGKNLLRMLAGAKEDSSEDGEWDYEEVNTTEPPLRRGTANSAGHDISTPIAFTLNPGEFYEVDTGVKSNIRPGFYFRVEGRSSLGRRGIEPFNGIIDSDFKDQNIKIIMKHGGKEVYEFKAGERIAQLVLQKYYTLDNSTIISTEAHTGFGSTGRI